MSLEEIIRRVERCREELIRKDGEKISLQKESIFVEDGSYLHETEESAKFERDNKKVFDFLRSMKQQFRDILHAGTSRGN